MDLNTSRDDSDEDLDSDGLSNIDEFLNFSYPNDPDTDGDAMTDSWEVENGFDPINFRDSGEDRDQDGLLNIFEFLIKTNASKKDTDDDLMWDGWEYDYDLDPLDASDAEIDLDGDNKTNVQEFLFDSELNPRNADTEGDSMPDGWEIDNLLNPLIDDSNADPDSDELVNSDEFTWETNPQIADSDQDGMPDGWEVTHHLGPTDSSDAKIDSDGDGFSNLREYELRRFGMDPNNPNDGRLLIGLLILGSVALGFGIYGIFILNRRVKFDGYNSLVERLLIRRKGFSTNEEFLTAKNNGFKNIRVRNLIKTTGFDSVTEMKSAWLHLQKIPNEEINTKQIEEQLKDISNASTPLQLINFEKISSLNLQKLNNLNSDLEKNLSLIALLFETKRIGRKMPLENLDQDDLLFYKTKLVQTLEKTIKFIQNIVEAIQTRKHWLKPWESLLNLIQVTGDNIPIKLDKIAKIVDTTEDQAEALVIELLKENKSLGEYDLSKKIYTKGQNILTEISEYLEFISESGFVTTDYPD